MEDVEGAALDLLPHRQVGGLDEALEEAAVAEAGTLAALGRGVEAIDAGAHAGAHQGQLVLHHGRQPLPHRVGILAQVLLQVHAMGKLHGQHEGRVERQHHQRLVVHGLHQPFDHAHRRVKERFGVARDLRPVAGLRDGGHRRQVLFILDLDEIHARGAKVFQVFVDGRPAFMVGGVEVQEERGRRVVEGSPTVYQIEKCVALFHSSPSVRADLG